MKSRIRLIAIVCTLLIHLVLVGLLSLEFSNQESSMLSDIGMDDLELQMEDFILEDLSLETPGNEPTTEQKENASESLSKDNGQTKDQATAVIAKVEAVEKPIIPVDPEDTIVKKIEVVKILKIDTVRHPIQDTISIATVIEKLQKTPQNTANNDEYVKRQRERFEFYRKNYRAVVNFKKVYPYAVKTREIIESVNEQLSKMTNESEKKKLIKETEKKLFKEYETAVRTMSTSQGKLLLKLIARETSKTGYDLIRDYKGKFSASFWYGVGRLFGTNLKTEYHKEGEDSVIENISNKYNNNDLY